MIVYVTNADSEILAVRSVVDGLPGELGPVHCTRPERFDPAVLSRAVSDPAVVDSGNAGRDSARAVIVRLLGGRASWEGFDELYQACRDGGIPLLAYGGEAVVDDELAGASTVPGDVQAEGFAYLVAGGLDNVANFFLFVADRVLGLGLGYGPPLEVPPCGILGEPEIRGDRPTVAVVFYRALFVAGNVMTVRELCRAIEDRGVNALPVYCYSLRDAPGDEAIALLESYAVDAVVTTVWAAGTADASGDGWDVTKMARLGVPVIQAIAATGPTESWEESSVGLSPMDVAMSIAIPEFDGRIVTVPFSFKEIVDEGEVVGSPVVAYRSVPDRVGRVAGIACRLATLRSVPVEKRRIGVVLSAYPTKKSRIGNAVGLDTPASVIRVLHEMRDVGYAVGDIPGSGDELMALLGDAVETLDGDGPAPTESRARLSFEEYNTWFTTLDESLRDKVVAAWGEPPGDVFVDKGTGDLVFAGLHLVHPSGDGDGDGDAGYGSSGAVFVAVQPPRGFGENPVAVYHSPDLPPTHHYLAFYRWLDATFRAHALVHVGKHGTLEWLPGKGVGLSAQCYPDAALGDMPLVYPFVVNDPGEGAQAKRRAHAVVVDHLVPPMTRAGTYDDVEQLETLLDEHARVLTLDPSKLPTIRRQVWDTVVTAEIHRDLGLASLEERNDFAQDSFDDLVGELDGYLCELKDAQIRGGLHVLGVPPSGEALVDMVLAITRVPQGRVPSLRETIAGELGVDLLGASLRDVDAVENRCRQLVEASAAGVVRDAPRAAVPVLEWIRESLVPALEASTSEIGSVLAALDGRFVPSGPSGAPTRGMAHVLPTGRNFYTIDPRAVPSRLSWEVGKKLAAGLVERFRAEEGSFPTSIGLVVWGTATMRTAGDDIAEALALLGVRPIWDGDSGRVVAVEAVPMTELGRPRVGVTLRISGFFRDAFSHLVALFEDAVARVSVLDESDDVNPIAAETRANGGKADARVFGPKPGAYGSGILPLLESRSWIGDEDLANVYVEWGGFSYTGSGVGSPAHDAFRRRLAGIEVAVKNQDNREHDIFDSDDYLQDHGGMIAAARALSGREPVAFFGDSSNPARPRVRSLSEEAARVVRTRVVNPKWIEAMKRHGYKGAFEMAATVDYVFGYDATARVIENWMYEKVTQRYVADPSVREFFRRSNPDALRSIAERLLEAAARDLWDASPGALHTLESAVLEAEGWEEEESAPASPNLGR